MIIKTGDPVKDRMFRGEARRTFFREHKIAINDVSRMVYGVPWERAFYFRRNTGMDRRRLLYKAMASDPRY